jgi:pyruvate/2-oxoacid:ferredoxin oxidoreductase beta subunit
MTVEIARLAVETGMWTLYEVEDGNARTTYKPKAMLPVTDYLKLQGRFRHMEDADIAQLQEWLCAKWYLHYGDEIEQPVCAMLEKGKRMRYPHEEQLHFV